MMRAAAGFGFWQDARRARDAKLGTKCFVPVPLAELYLGPTTLVAAPACNSKERTRGWRPFRKQPQRQRHRDFRRTGR